MIRHKRALGFLKRLLEKVESRKINQCLIVLLEARAREFLGVARRESKRKQEPAATLCSQGRPPNRGSVTPNRPEAVVIYT